MAIEFCALGQFRRIFDQDFLSVAGEYEGFRLDRREFAVFKGEFGFVAVRVVVFHSIHQTEQYECLQGACGVPFFPSSFSYTSKVFQRDHSLLLRRSL